MSARAFGPGSSVTIRGASFRSGGPLVATVTSCSSPRATPPNPRHSLLRDHRLGLLAEVLLHVVHAAAPLTAGPRRLPPAERLHPGPRAGGRTVPLVQVHNASRDLVAARGLLPLV